MPRTALDVAGALASYLESTTVMDVIVPGKVYRPKLPKKADLPAVMPFACVVLTQNGGYQRFGGGLVPVGDPRIEARCFGKSELEAGLVAGEVVNAIRALRQSVWPETSAAGAKLVRLYPSRIEGGPMPLTDPDTNWPYAFLGLQIVAGELAVE